jgi:hypothetical protein
MADQLMKTKEFVVKVSGTWTYFRTISAASAADARDIADLEFQEMDMSELANTVRAFDFGDIEILK